MGRCLAWVCVTVAVVWVFVDGWAQYFGGAAAVPVFVFTLQFVNLTDVNNSTN